MVGRKKTRLEKEEEKRMEEMREMGWERRERKANLKVALLN